MQPIGPSIPFPFWIVLRYVWKPQLPTGMKKVYWSQAWHVNTLFSSLTLPFRNSGAIEAWGCRISNFHRIFSFLISEEAARRGHQNTGWSGWSKNPSGRLLGAQFFQSTISNTTKISYFSNVGILKANAEFAEIIGPLPRRPEKKTYFKSQLAYDALLRRFREISWKRGRSSSSEGLGSGSLSLVPEMVSTGTVKNSI